MANFCPCVVVYAHREVCRDVRAEGFAILAQNALLCS